MRRKVDLPIQIHPQPNDVTCGPTSLHSVYQYWGDSISLSEVIESCKSLETEGVGRGTLAAMLGSHAQQRGYSATLYTFNLHHFDPTWFDEDGRSNSHSLIEKLRLQASAKSVVDPRFPVGTASYIEFLSLGGRICLQDLTSQLLSDYLLDETPVLVGLSSTYLYRCPREFGPNDDYDDLRGEPCGHFVVLHGYDSETRCVRVADPLADNPGFDGQHYSVSMNRLVPSIMLGVITYDSNVLVIKPRDR